MPSDHPAEAGVAGTPHAGPWDSAVGDVVDGHLVKGLWWLRGVRVRGLGVLLTDYVGGGPGSLRFPDTVPIKVAQKLLRSPRPPPAGRRAGSAR